MPHSLLGAERDPNALLHKVKTAAQLINEYGDLDTLLEKGKVLFRGFVGGPVNQEIMKKSLSVRQVEELTASRRQRRNRNQARRGRVNPRLAGWEDQLRHAFGTQVRIKGGTARGRIEISYFSEEDLERVLEVTGILSGSTEAPVGSME